MSQKTILSFFKLTDSSTAKVHPIESKTNHDTKMSSTVLNIKKSSQKNDPKKANTNISEKKSPVKKVSVTNGISEKLLIKEDKNSDVEKSVDKCSYNSPVKQPQKRTKKVIESDDDTKDSNKPSELQIVTHTDDEKMEIGDINKVSDGTEYNTTNDIEKTQSKSHLKRKQTAISDDSPVKTTKRKRTALIESEEDEEDNEEKSSESNKKTKVEESDVEKSIDSNESNNEEKHESDLCSPSTSLNVLNTSAEVIPKRKTARRQINGKQNEKETSIKTQDSEKKKCNSQELPASVNDLSSSVNEKIEGSESAEKKTDEEIKQESEELSNESKKQRIKETSNSKKSIHPFFAGKKKASNEKCDKSIEKKSDKKDIKCNSTSGTSYDPSKNRYHPVDDACWKKGEKVPYLALAKTLECIEDTSARFD
ncbi:DNA ligase [Nephila pilipes]|uniref:DNA ligase n=1 Tax=Nephila pilipes TaxID=299642 RepID=A0A8X6QPW6_NEPPI|nr:DNA ligase [Nephila pilipes]